jgi:3-isopropylmalate/(R)-2-methylmalate dehydratase large subunit
MEADEKVDAWLEGRASREYQAVYPDPDAVYARRVELDVSRLEPQVACPHAVDNVVPLKNEAGRKIDQAVIGTCTNGRLEDLKIAAEVLKGRRVNPGVRLVVAPASRSVLLEGIREGVIQVLLEAGAALVTPGCGPCVGTHNGVPADGETVFSTANRNFKGRMGNSKASIFLGSPAAVAASAVTGMITDPREFV